MAWIKYTSARLSDETRHVGVEAHPPLSNDVVSGLASGVGLQVEHLGPVFGAEPHGEVHVVSTTDEEEPTSRFSSFLRQVGNAAAQAEGVSGYHVLADADQLTDLVDNRYDCGPDWAVGFSGRRDRGTQVSHEYHP